MQDIIFNEYTFFDDKSEFLFSQMIAEMNNLITKIRLSEAQTTNECLLEEDEKILKSSFNSEDDELNSEEVAAFDEKKDYELVRALEDILLMLSSSEVDIKIVFHIQLLIRMND